MTKLLVFISIFTSLLAQSSEDEEHTETVWSVIPSIFDCSPKLIRPGDPIKLMLGHGHGWELAVRKDTTNEWWFLVVGSPPLDMKSLMARDALLKAREVTISSTTTGYRWDAKGGNEKFFLEPGSYTIFNSETLESEVGGYICKITVQ